MSDIEKNETGDNLTLWEPFFFVTSETNENDINFDDYRMAIRHNQPNGENNIKCKLTLRNNKYKLEEVPDGKISAKKVGKYNMYEFFMWYPSYISCEENIIFVKIIFNVSPSMVITIVCTMYY